MYLVRWLFARLGVLLSVIFGGLLLRERPLRPRLRAAYLMVTAVALRVCQGPWPS